VEELEDALEEVDERLERVGGEGDHALRGV
jgi:hypothetical protein